MSRRVGFTSAELLVAIAIVAMGVGLLWPEFRDAPVDADKAREALRLALESWKRGDTIDALQAATPAIYIVDPQWKAGESLKDFRILGEGTERDALLNCPVVLITRSPNGEEVKKEVFFKISTAPRLTVARKIF